MEEAQVEELIPVLKKVTIFSGITDDGLRRVIRECVTLFYPCGTTVIEKGTRATEILIILSGKVTVSLSDEDELFEVCSFGPGSCIGEMSVIGILNHSATVITAEETEVLVLSRKVMNGIFENDKNFFSILILNIARELARRLHRTDEILLHYTRKQRLKPAE